jgi:hypothetical protein
MAKPIAHTPVLKGQEALAFLENFYNKITHKPTPKETATKAEELKRMEASYKAIQSISNGTI